MEIKKTKRADLEYTKVLSFMMGLVVALAIIFTAFEWGTREIEVSDEAEITELIAEEEIEITRDEPEPEPEPEPQKQVAAEILNIVDDDVKLQDQELLSSEDDQSIAAIATYTPPSVVVEEAPDENRIFESVENMPEFPGGNDKINAWITKHCVYPQFAIENNISGVVFVGFVVEKDGTVSAVKPLRSVDPSLDKEAVRVVKSMPKWKPGRQQGKPVRCKYSVPVRFRITS